MLKPHNTQENTKCIQHNPTFQLALFCLILYLLKTFLGVLVNCLSQEYIQHARYKPYHQYKDKIKPKISIHHFTIKNTDKNDSKHIYLNLILDFLKRLTIFLLISRQIFYVRLSFFSVCVCLLATQSCPTLCDPMDYSLSGSSVHGILQAKVLEYVAISFFLQ